MTDTVLIVHLLGMAMGVGTSIGMMFLGIAGSKLEKEEGQKFMIHSMALSKMGHIGLVLLVISGIYLAYLKWDYLSGNHLFYTKMALVLLLSAMIGIISAKGKRALRSENVEAELAKIRPLGMIALVSSLAIVVVAVLLFH